MIQAVEEPLAQPAGRPGLALANKSCEERMIATEKIRILHPYSKRLFEKIKECHTTSKYSAEPECLFIQGRSGVGKSTLIKLYSSRFPRSKDADGNAVVPVFGARVPAPATVKSLVTRLLRALGDPAFDRGTTDDRTTRLRDFMAKCKAELFFIDEFQHIIDPNRKAILKDVSDWLKLLVEDTEVPVILIGLPSSAIILDTDPQLDDRFSARETLPPFTWDSQTDREYFEVFLRSLDSNLPFEKRSQLGSEDMALRFFYASGGILRPVMKLIRKASHTSIRRRLPCIGMNELAEAFEDLNVGRNGVVENPFEVEVSVLKENLGPAVAACLEREAADDVVPGAVRRGVRGKKKKVKAVDALRK